ncbi:hypothetical protein DEO72_LG9g1873 [Vigna unguiculata]|uniref:Uncharacterized protein n=1 Tax=Vigna unguiculata TaxID=3917 RepID=A0A4D6N2W8_VIGUN|nr:hypothetical protein DEO72_LG9g1873 [Vigna unguiculata]
MVALVRVCGGHGCALITVAVDESRYYNDVVPVIGVVANGGEVQMRWWCLQRERRDAVVLMVARAWFRWYAEMENGDGGARNKLPWWPKVTFLAVRHHCLPGFQQPKSPPSSQFNVASLVSNNPRVGRIQSSASPPSFPTTQESLISNNPKFHPVRSLTSPPSFPTGQKVVFFVDPRRARHDLPHSISHGL